MEAKATGKNLPLSTKVAVMVCQYLRGRKLSSAKRILGDVLTESQAIPFTRFTDGVGHRKGIPAAGRYPQKASKEILTLLKSAEANAVAKGMSSDLVVFEIRACRASQPMRMGRQARREAKRVHVWVTLKEASDVAPKKGVRNAAGAKTAAPKKASAKSAAKKTSSQSKENTMKDQTSKTQSEANNGN